MTPSSAPLSSLTASEDEKLSAEESPAERAAEAHRRAGLAAVTGAHYEGGHWLGSFAVYLATKRGLAQGEIK